MPGPEPLLVVRGLTKHFLLYQPWLLGLVGKSGCGKTTTARLIQQQPGSWRTRRAVLSD